MASFALDPWNGLKMSTFCLLFFYAMAAFAQSKALYKILSISLTLDKWQFNDENNKTKFLYKTNGKYKVNIYALSQNTEKRNHSLKIKKVKTASV